MTMRGLGLGFWRASVVVVAVLLLLGVAPSAARADGFIIVERPPHPPTPGPQRRQAFFPLQVKIHSVDVSIEDGVAQTHIDQTFFNPNPTQLEGTYIFPLPADAAVTRFSMFMDGREVEGEVLDRDRARSIYEGIVRRMQDPALLEYMGRGAFRARVFPIPARGEKRIKLSYSQVLGRSGPLHRYVYPLNTEKFSSAPLERVLVRCRIKSSSGSVRTVYSPSHEVEVTRQGEQAAEVVYERHGVKPDRDFVLYYGGGESEVELSVLSYRDHDGGYFVALVSPQTASEKAKPLAKDVVFVLDTSGSMAGEKLEQARRALVQAIDRLGDEDRFSVVDFSTDVRSLDEKLVAADAGGKERARQYVKGLRARGGTAIHDALLKALGYGSGEGRPFFVVFVTDGQPTIGVTESAEILAAAGKHRRGNERLFVLGIGEDVNTHLLDQLAEQNRGDRDYVLPEEEVEIIVSSFIDKLSYPVLTDVSVEFEGSWVRDIYPRQLGDLFRGNQVVITGRYRDEGGVAIRLRGRRGDERVEQVYESRFSAQEDHDFVARLWSRRKIAFLLDQMRLNGESAEVRNEVVFLAKKFGIVTPYTSILVVEDDVESVVRAPSGNRGHNGRLNEERDESAGKRSTGAPGASAGAEAFRRIRGLREPNSAPQGGGSRRGFDRQGAPNRPQAEDKLGDAREAFARKSGEGALRLAKDLARQSAQKKETYDEDGSEAERLAVSGVLRRVAGRTFYMRDGVWVDSSVETLDGAVDVDYLSDEYFALLAEHSELAACFALGQQVVVLLDGKVYRVVEG